MDPNNAAVVSKTGITPAMLEEVATSPKIIGDVARKHLLVQMDAMYHRMKDPNVSVRDRNAYIDILSRLGDAYPKASAANVPVGSGFGVNIILSGGQTAVSVKAAPQPTIIEGDTRVVDDEQPDESLSTSPDTNSEAQPSVSDDDAIFDDLLKE